jgi:hypothetical protein
MRGHARRELRGGTGKRGLERKQARQEGAITWGEVTGSRHIVDRQDGQTYRDRQVGIGKGRAGTDGQARRDRQG